VDFVRSPSLEYTTTYRLTTGADALEVETVWSNEGEEVVPISPTDNVAWGAAAAFVPNYGFMPVQSPKGPEFRGEWVAGLAGLDNYSVVVFSDMRGFLGRHVTSSSHLRWVYREDEDLDLDPGENMLMRRYVMPGTRDYAASVEKAYSMQKIPLGFLTGR